jgi:acyl-CoA hydrolase/GNAT superfamily N-acetyltransferase
VKEISTARTTTADRALAALRSGQHVLIGSGAAEPQALVDALAARGESLFDVEILHLLTLGEAPYADARFAGHLRHNALFIGPNVRAAVGGGLADYTPCYLSEIPSMIREGRMPVDVALIQVAPPEDGTCSLGISVDILKAAVESASYVVAQVNPRMPRTAGDSRISVGDIDAFVLFEAPLLELPRARPGLAAEQIGRNVANLVADGSTIQLGIGSIPDAVLAALAGKRNLGVHSEMVSDGVLALVASGAINGRKKTLHPGKIVVSFCLGSQALYDAAREGGPFEIRPCDYVNDPFIISRNDNMVSINSALAVDLTGQVAADSVGSRFYSGFGGQVDFIRGAARSRGGRSIIALPSTARSGTVSRISCCLPEGTGIVTTRADVDFVVTEFGIASLKGKTIRERAVALIQVAHPAFRDQLTTQAKERGYIDAGRAAPPSSGSYPVELETRRHFKGVDVFFRPIKPSDERRLKDLFYSQSMETTVMRFGIPLKRLPERDLQRMAGVDYRESMAIAGFVKENGRERMIAVGRYCGAPGSKAAEAAFTVHDDYQGRGIGSFLVNYLAWIARERGLEVLTAEVMSLNPRMRRALSNSFAEVDERDLGPDGISLKLRLSAWKGAGNPALDPAVARR